ncbi:MAG TPA: DUF2490 domain-containing protein [Vicinamibacterales bacterium]|nr:DUF2490 domain-containing protein [Vicinamibacterales bacterium]
MSRKIIFFLLSAVLFSSTEALGQTVTDERVWFTTTLQEPGNPGSPWRWSFETTLRSREGVSELDTVVVRPTLIYALTPHSSIGVGYAFVPSFPATGGTTLENRIYGQYIWTGPAGGGTLTMRTRVESRFIEANSGPLGRVRQQVRYSRPVRQGSRLSWVGWDELSLHLNNTSRSPRGVDQNRAFGGLSLAATGRVRVESGYLNQFLPGHRGAPDRRNHILSGTLTISF